LKLPFGVLIPILAAALAASQLFSLGLMNVVIGLALVASGLLVFALRDRSHLEIRGRTKRWSVDSRHH